MTGEYAIGLVLAGGSSRRLGQEKGSMSVGGRPMLSRVFDAVTPVVDEMILVGGPAAPTGIRLAPDDEPGAGPLAAIRTGMQAALAELYLVVACDMPFVNSELLRHLLVSARDFDAAVPFVAGRDQTLCAVYSRSCLSAIVEALAAGHRRVADFFPAVSVCRLEEAELTRFGPPEVLFFNVNTPEQLVLAEQMARALRW